VGQKGIKHIYIGKKIYMLAKITEMCDVAHRPLVLGGWVCFCFFILQLELVLKKNPLN
jgi:hypothetical protein